MMTGLWDNPSQFYKNDKAYKLSDSIYYHTVYKMANGNKQIKNGQYTTVRITRADHDEIIKMAGALQLETGIRETAGSVISKLIGEAAAFTPRT